MSQAREEIKRGLALVLNGLRYGVIELGQYRVLVFLWRSVSFGLAGHIVARVLGAAYLWVQRRKQAYWIGVRRFVDAPIKESTDVPRTMLKFGESYIDNTGRVLQEVLSVDTGSVIGVADVTKRSRLVADELSVLSKTMPMLPPGGSAPATSVIRPEMSIPGSQTTVTYNYPVPDDEVRFYTKVPDADGSDEYDGVLVGHGVRISWSRASGPTSFLVTCKHVYIGSSIIRGSGTAHFELSNAPNYRELGDLIILELPEYVWSMLGVAKSKVGRLYQNEIVRMSEAVEPDNMFLRLVKSKSVRLTTGSVRGSMSDSNHIFGFYHTISTNFGHSGRAIRNKFGQPIAIHCARDESLELNIGIALYRSVDVLFASTAPPSHTTGESGDPVYTEMWTVSEAPLPDRMKRRIGKREFTIDADHGVYKSTAIDIDNPEPWHWAEMVDAEDPPLRRKPENAFGLAGNSGPSTSAMPDFRMPPLGWGGVPPCPSQPSLPGPLLPHTETSGLSVSRERGNHGKKPKSSSQGLTPPTQSSASVGFQPGEDLEAFRKRSRQMQKQLAKLEKSLAIPGQANSAQQK